MGSPAAAELEQTGQTRSLQQVRFVYGKNGKPYLGTGPVSYTHLTEEADIEKLAKAQGKSVETIKNIIASLHEFNPMMGHRGCRLAVTLSLIHIYYNTYCYLINKICDGYIKVAHSK